MHSLPQTLSTGRLWQKVSFMWKTAEMNKEFFFTYTDFLSKALNLPYYLPIAEKMLN